MAVNNLNNESTDNFFDVTDTDESGTSNTSVYNRNAIVLDVANKDQPNADSNTNDAQNLSKIKVRKTKKKKRLNKTENAPLNSSSTSETDSIINMPIDTFIILDDPVREEFYDALENYSYDANAENSSGPERYLKLSDMDKDSRYKGKSKKQPAQKPKTSKKRKIDGPSCSMFLAEITKKLATRRKQEVEPPINVVQSIINSITNALPIKISKRSPPETPSPVRIETLIALSPELLPKDTVQIPVSPLNNITNDPVLPNDEVPFKEISEKSLFNMPKMPVLSSEIFKTTIEKRKKPMMVDQTTATSSDQKDVASEIAKHVVTLKKISMIAEEFNQKTAKNLKEIVDSVQEDLMKKLEEIQAEQKAQAEAQAQVLKIQEESAKEILQEE